MFNFLPSIRSFRNEKWQNNADQTPKYSEDDDRYGKFLHDSLVLFSNLKARENDRFFSLTGNDSLIWIK